MTSPAAALGIQLAAACSAGTTPTGWSKRRTGRAGGTLLLVPAATVGSEHASSAARQASSWKTVRASRLPPASVTFWMNWASEVVAASTPGMASSES